MKLKKIIYYSIVFLCIFAFDKVYALTSGIGNGSDTGGSSASCWSKGCIHTGYSGLRVTLVDKNGNIISGTHSVDFWNNVPSAKALSGTTYKSAYMNRRGGISTSISSYSVSTSTNTGLVGGISYSNQHELVQGILDKDLKKCKLSDPSTCKSNLLSTLGLSDLTSLIAKKSDCESKLKETYLLLEPVYYININGNNIVVTGTEYTYLIYYYYTVLGDKNTTYNLNGAAGYGNAMVNMYLAKLDAGDSTKYAFNANGSKYHIFTETSPMRYSDAPDWLHTAAWGGNSSHYPVGSSMHLVWFGGLTDDVCDSKCDEEKAKKDASSEGDGFDEACCEEEEYVNAYFDTLKKNGEDITEEDVNVCCFTSEKEINKQFCDIVDKYSDDEDLCDKYCKPTGDKCDATEDIENCCDICEDDEYVVYIAPDGKNKGKKVKLKCDLYKERFCGKLESDCDENQAKEDASKGTFDKGCCSDTDYLNYYAQYSNGNKDEIYKQYCEEETKKCELPKYEPNPSCKPADCDSQITNENPSNIAWFSDFDENSTNGLMQYIVKDAYGINLQQTKSNFQNVDKNLSENLAKNTFAAMANPENAFGGENTRVPVKTSTGAENPYCNLYCQEIAVVALPDFYPGVNAGRYFQWYISGNSNGALVKQQILKVCAEDIKLDQLMEEYYQWMKNVQEAFDKYENFTDGLYIKENISLLDGLTDGYEWNKAYGDVCFEEANKCQQNQQPVAMGPEADGFTYDYNFGLYTRDGLYLSQDQTGLYRCLNYNPMTNSCNWQYAGPYTPSNNQNQNNQDCSTMLDACINEARKYTKDKILNEIKSKVNNDFNSKLEQYKECFNVGQDLGIEITSNLKLQVTNSLDNSSYTEFTKVENSKDYFTGPSYCFDKPDCELGDDRSFFVYEPIIDGKVAKDMTCNGGFADTTLHKNDGKNKVYNLVTENGSSFSSLPLDYENFIHNSSDNSLRFFSNNRANISEYAKTFRLLVYSSDTDYVMDNKKAACVCSDGSVVDLEQDERTSEYYCPCDPETSTTGGQTTDVISEDASLKFAGNSGKCSYTAYTKISDYGSYIVNYSTHSGSYALDIQYSDVGSTNNGKAHFSNISCGASGNSRCTSGSCYYSGQFCKILVGNSLMYDEWSNEKTENWSLHASYYKCRNGECENPDNPDNPNCPNGQCENPINPNCPNGQCDNPSGGPVCTVETCPPNVTPCQNGKCENASGLSVVYRTVDMNDPFPGREPGENWKEGTSYFSGSTGNRGQSGSSIYNSSSDVEPLYHFELSPAALKQIRNANAANGYNYSDTSTIAYPRNKVQTSNSNVGLLRKEDGTYNMGISRALREVLAPIIEQYNNRSEEDAVKMVGYKNWCPEDRFGYEYCQFIMYTYEDVMAGDFDCWSHAIAYKGTNGG